MYRAFGCTLWEKQGKACLLHLPSRASLIIYFCGFILVTMKKKKLSDFTNSVIIASKIFIGLSKKNQNQNQKTKKKPWNSFTLTLLTAISTNVKIDICTSRARLR